jgi:hypothetical protein
MVICKFGWRVGWRSALSRSIDWRVGWRRIVYHSIDWRGISWRGVLWRGVGWSWWRALSPVWRLLARLLIWRRLLWLLWLR